MSQWRLCRLIVNLASKRDYKGTSITQWKSKSLGSSERDKFLAHAWAVMIHERTFTMVHGKYMFHVRTVMHKQEKS